MKRFLFSISLLLLLAACTKSYDWNQKLTLYITTPSGEVVASSVIRIDATDTTSKFFPVEGRKFQNKTTGEAVVVDLGQGRYLFALLKNKLGNPVDQIHEAYSDVLHEPRRASWGKWVRVLKRQEEPGVLPIRAYPMLVTFDDVTDPKSVRLVDPADLAASFGAGYALREATLEITREPVTKGVIGAILLCIDSGKQCGWHGLDVPYGHPLSNLNGAFIRRNY